MLLLNNVFLLLTLNKFFSDLFTVVLFLPSRIVKPTHCLHSQKMNFPHRPPGWSKPIHSKLFYFIILLDPNCPWKFTHFLPSSHISKEEESFFGNDNLLGFVFSLICDLAFSAFPSSCSWTFVVLPRFYNLFLLNSWSCFNFSYSKGAVNHFIKPQCLSVSAKQL